MSSEALEALLSLAYERCILIGWRRKSGASAQAVTNRDRGALPSSSGPKLGQLHLLGSGAGHLFSIRLRDCVVDVRPTLAFVPRTLLITYS